METKYPDKWQEKRRAKPVWFVSRNQKRPGRHFYCFLETKHAKNPGLFPMFPFSCVSTSTLLDDIDFDYLNVTQNKSLQKEPKPQTSSLSSSCEKASDTNIVYRRTKIIRSAEEIFRNFVKQCSFSLRIALITSKLSSSINEFLS